jgi:hypothetical protein
MSKILALSMLFVFMFPLPHPRPRHATRPRPIEAAFADIRLGMTEEELVALMAPYEEVNTEHFQWRNWTDGHTIVLFTVWPKDFRPIGPLRYTGPDLVQDKKMFRERP